MRINYTLQKTTPNCSTKEQAPALEKAPERYDKSS
jgi:hypothetical protein